MNVDSLIKAQTDIAERLANSAYFTDIPVVTDRKKDIVTEIQRNLGMISGKGGKCGVCVVVLQPQASTVRREVPCPSMLLDLTIRVQENVTINTGATGTTKPAASVARAICDILHLYTAGGIMGPMRPKNPQIIAAEDPLAPVAYDVAFEADEIRANVPSTGFKCGAVSITETGSALPYTIALSCATSGASIYYTLDGSYPGQYITTAHLYSTPFSITTACTLRVGASKSGLVDSDTTSATIS